MLKIGVLTKPIEEGSSGSGSHLEKLMNHVLKLNSKFEIILLHYEHSNKSIYLNNKHLIIPKNPILASIALYKNKFDLIHYSPLNIKSPLFIPGIKRVATIHGGAPYIRPEDYSLMYNFQHNYIRPVLIGKMNKIFTVSEKSRELITDRDGYNKENIIITSNAVDQIFKQKEVSLSEINNKYNFKGKFIFHLSKYSERKNPWAILHTIKTLNEKQINVNLILGGKGWENTEVNTFIEKHQLKKRVLKLGFLTTPEIIDLYNSAEVFLFPSLYEGCGMPNLEAMACGCPVITSDSFAIPEIVNDAALILKNSKDHNEISDLIINLFNNENQRKELQKRGLKRSKEFSWITSAKIVLNTYEELLINNITHLS